MNTTGTVLFVRAAGADGGGPEALEGQFDVVVAEGAIDGVKRLSTEPTAPDCLVTRASLRDLTLEAFLAQVDGIAPDVPIVVVGELPDDAAITAAVGAADEHVSHEWESTLPDVVGRLLGQRRVDRAVRRHERLARTVAAVAADVAGAEHRDEVESAFHDRLVEGGSYRHVWVARREAGQLTVTLPVSGPLGEDDLAALVGGGDPSFVHHAIETGTVVSTKGRVPTRSSSTASTVSASTGPLYDGGETAALSSAAVPFVHDGRIWGVGLVSTERSDAFDSSERELLSDLGAVVGHALWARESVDPTEATTDLARGMENLVHDLRNPLGIARSYLEMAREEDSPESLDRVESAVDRMVAIVDRVATGVGGVPAVDATTADLEETARAAWESVDVPPGSLVVVGSAALRADRELLVRLLANLFQNAVDHAGEDVTVRVGALPGGFYVEDDGPGIPPAEREFVFQRGYSTADDGLGIGLSIVEDVANAHGWSLAVTEAGGGGARFEVTGVERDGEDETA